jgi:hypothetical protein
MAGLDPAIHVFLSDYEDVDTRIISADAPRSGMTTLSKSAGKATR